ncbi:FAD-binding oxidoreductase [Arthrobacter sp. 7Tela_A1]|uniref:FAD-binding oxidoreductase n=1 Tax=Arthrobacter sp. 7Tela_A1 TaxID=3093745 RepID=UPI003BB77C70
MIQEQDLETLRGLVSGIIGLPGEAVYAEDTAAFNLAQVHRPDATLGALDAGDVTRAVGWAAERSIPVAVQATGHNASAPMDEGLLVNASRLQEVAVDPASGAVTVGAGARWSSVLEKLLPLGLTAAHGSSSSVGVVGYTLGGGLPLMGRTLGFASDHVRSFDLVTPDGRHRRIDPETEPELFTVLRGGKGNFGIVTSMTLGVVPLGEFYGGQLVYAEDSSARVLELFRQWAPTLPREASASLAFMHLPDLPFLPEEMRGTAPVILRFGFFGEAGEAAELLAPMREVQALRDTTGPMNYRDIDAVHGDPTDPAPGMERGMLLTELSDETASELLQQIGPGSGTPLVMAELRLLGGALGEAPAFPDAVSGRSAAFHLFILGVAGPSDGDPVQAALTRLALALEPWAAGSLINFHGPAGDEANRARAWEPEMYTRLRDAKAAWDPQNLFRYGHAVPPVGLMETAPG